MNMRKHHRVYICPYSRVYPYESFPVEHKHLMIICLPSRRVANLSNSSRADQSTAWWCHPCSDQRRIIEARSVRWENRMKLTLNEYYHCSFVSLAASVHTTERKRENQYQWFPISVFCLSKRTDRCINLVVNDQGRLDLEKRTSILFQFQVKDQTSVSFSSSCFRHHDQGTCPEKWPFSASRMTGPLLSIRAHLLQSTSNSRCDG